MSVALPIDSYALAKILKSKSALPVSRAFSCVRCEHAVDVAGKDYHDKTKYRTPNTE